MTRLFAILCLFSLVACDATCIEDAYARRGRRDRFKTPAGTVVSYALDPTLLSSDAGWMVTFTGQSLTLGTSGTPALSTASVYANAFRFKSSYPPDVICEGTATPPTCAGTGANVEYPVTAMLDQIRSTHGSAVPDWIARVRATSGAAYSVIKKGGSGSDYANLFNVSTGEVKQQFDAYQGEAPAIPFYVPAAVIYHGEADSDASLCATYEAAMVEYQADIQADVQTITGQTQAVPLFMHQVASEGTAGASTDTAATCARAQEQAATNNDPIFVSKGGYHCGSGTASIYAGDGVHLTNAGYRCEAELMGRAAHAVLVDDWLWNPLIPTSVSASGSTAIVEYSGHVPCTALGDCSGNPIVFDTTNVVCPWTGDQEDSTTNCYMGFELICTGPNPPHITGVSVSGTQVTVTANKTITSDCQLAYARSSIATATSGNGASTGNGSQRGNVRDTTSAVGDRSGTTLYTWGATWQRAISGAATSPSSVAEIIEDLAPTYAYVSDATNCPGSGIAWVDAMGNYTMPYDSGSGACDTNTSGSATAATIGASRINEAMDNTDGCWRNAAGSSQFDLAANEDFMLVLLGKPERSAAGYDHLFYFRGDSPTNNQFWLGINDTGGLGGVLNLGGTNLTYVRAALVPATPADDTIVIYIDKKGHPNTGVGQMTVCLGTDCATGSAASAFGATGTGRTSLLGDNNCGNEYVGDVSALMIFKGEQARAAVARKGTVSDFAAYVASRY